MQLSIGPGQSGIIGIIGLPDQSSFIRLCFEMPVQTIFGHVDFSTLKPFNGWGLKLPFQDLIIWLLPFQFVSYVGPEACRIVNTLLIIFFILVPRSEERRVGNEYV